jgi:PKD repeat protein
MRGGYRNYRAYQTAIATEPISGLAAPLAEATTTPAGGSVPVAVAFDGTASAVAPGSTIVAWEWNFGDGSPPSSGPSVQHTYSAPGSWWATLTITDQTGAKDTIATEITATR